MTALAVVALLGAAWWAVAALARANRTVDDLLAECDAAARQRHPSNPRPAAATAPTEPATGAGRAL
jgi:hypothetical protein